MENYYRSHCVSVGTLARLIIVHKQFAAAAQSSPVRIVSSIAKPPKRSQSTHDRTIMQRDDGSLNSVELCGGVYSMCNRPNERSDVALVNSSSSLGRSQGILNYQANRYNSIEDGKNNHGIIPRPSALIRRTQWARPRRPPVQGLTSTNVTWCRTMLADRKRMKYIEVDQT
nr:hypothetical protein CFP56_11548 [Quercus suber]